MLHEECNYLHALQPGFQLSSSSGRVRAGAELLLGLRQPPGEVLVLVQIVLVVQDVLVTFLEYFLKLRA